MRRSGPAYLLVFVVALFGPPPAFGSLPQARVPGSPPLANRTGLRKGCLCTQNLDPPAGSY